MAAKIPAAGVDLDGAITINESGEDKDFRVESNNQANMFFVNGGTDDIGMGGETARSSTEVASGGNMLSIGGGGSSAAGLELVGYSNTNGGGVCHISFLNGQNADGANFDADSKHLALIYIRASTSDSNAGDDSGSLFSIYTKVEATAPKEMMRIDGSQNTTFGQTSTTTPGYGNTTAGHSLKANGAAHFSSTGVTHGFARSNDGSILAFSINSTSQGFVTVSGSTVSYGAFTGSHWSRLADNSKPTILRGTIMESLDEMCDWYQAVADVAETKDEFNNKIDGYKVKAPISLPNGKSVGDAVTFTVDGVEHTGVYEKEDDIKHVKCKISDTANSKRVYGVFSNWDDADDGLDGDVNDMNIAQVGTFVIRVNKDVTVSAGDLLVSNGDGTAKVLEGSTPITADIQSSIVAKVNSNIKVETYSDGSYTVPCTLHC
tara:strand:+ start:35 stop:1333 length:1299 start_codon:yes stop_codon:yes gene_type:complete